ncbi:hypothetical protein, partial [Roseibium sp. SCP14]|uniref:hypothetical protein n=1 Tax=Roseibium sp. SCP14 TaxID=3141375 RepID=UPI003339E227
DLTFGFTATDSDGDTATSTFTVTINDDAGSPSVGTTETVSLTEDATGSAGSETFVSSSETGSLNVLWGADDAD